MTLKWEIHRNIRPHIPHFNCDWTLLLKQNTPRSRREFMWMSSAILYCIWSWCWRWWFTPFSPCWLVPCVVMDKPVPHLKIVSEDEILTLEAFSQSDHSRYVCWRHTIAILLYPIVVCSLQPVHLLLQLLASIINMIFYHPQPFPLTPPNIELPYTGCVLCRYFIGGWSKVQGLQSASSHHTDRGEAKGVLQHLDWNLVFARK